MIRRLTRAHARLEKVERTDAIPRAANLAALLLIAAALAGCSDTTRSIGEAADRARGATERMVEESRIQDQQREAKALPNSDQIHRASGVTLTRRYEIREGPDGYMVYDTQRHQIARIGDDTQVGKDLDQAEQALDALNYADAKGRDLSVR